MVAVECEWFASDEKGRVEGHSDTIRCERLNSQAALQTGEPISYLRRTRAQNRDEIIPELNIS